MIMIRQFVKSFVALLISCCACYTVYAENKSYANDNWLDWQEDEIASFPQFDPKKAIAIHLDPQSQMQWYVDPNTVTLGKDHIPRYVVLAVSKTGIVNAMYEGIFCKNNTYKVYARTIGKEDQNDFDWRPADNPQWQNISDLPPYAHQKVLARLVMCDEYASPTSIDVILRRLKNPYTSPASPTERWR